MNFLSSVVLGYWPVDHGNNTLSRTVIPFYATSTRHGCEAASQEAEAEALEILESKAKATASQRLRSQSHSLKGT